MSASKQTIAFFGATGGCACAALAAALRNGHTCTALARTPDKLRNMLTTTHLIPATTLDSQLTIHAGDVKDSSAVQKVLTLPSNPSVLVDTILFGVGSTPALQWSIMQPVTLTDPTLCEVGMSTVLSTLSCLTESGVSTTAYGKKPFIITISTTGISDGKRDVPYLLYPLYHWLLQVPHVDKKKAEQLLVNDKGANSRDFVIIRPTLLTDGAARGLGKVRVGWEWGVRKETQEKELGPALGWTVGRTDVGEFIFREVVVKGGWEGKCVTLTY
ncbi:uncharacterized protein BDR25DRAFT_294742 [Lindgomyces ingoldianus]|uniref:Uncharacterized protein n=1 Tax=Lindgomyces ingoldianus TaxID=673940 RepID=A0ACB6QGS8_9PLEO|nr:uncharacterized protein BDR25DRAFT_294742 [Lindgomyces ingoldianus]KAF2465715.1 hypothetical protein BDR25DRAFT_294742 [Lindgomyces ingoldianus]